MILFRYIFTVFSNIFVCCIAWAVLHITNNKDSSSQIGPDDANKFQEVLLIGLGVGSITSFLFHVFVKEGAVDNINGKIFLLKLYHFNDKNFIYLSLSFSTCLHCND